MPQPSANNQGPAPFPCRARSCGLDGVLAPCTVRVPPPHPGGAAATRRRHAHTMDLNTLAELAGWLMAVSDLGRGWQPPITTVTVPTPAV